MNNEFRYLLRVRYSECDAQKVVFNARYSEYVDIAAGEFTRAIWGDYNDMLANGVDNQVVSFSIDWQAPAHFDDVLSISVKPERIGNSSYTFEVVFYHHQSHKIIATAKIVYVMVSAAHHKKMTIPNNMRTQLEKGALGITVDHAGLKDLIKS